MERIILPLVSLLCFFPFYMLAWIGKSSREPMHFVNGDEKQLKAIITDVPNYNREMAALYRRFSWVYLVAALVGITVPFLCLFALMLNSTLGLYAVYRRHKELVKKYSAQERITE